MLIVTHNRELASQVPRQHSHAGRPAHRQRRKARAEELAPAARRPIATERPRRRKHGRRMMPAEPDSAQRRRVWPPAELRCCRRSAGCCAAGIAAVLWLLTALTATASPLSVPPQRAGGVPPRCLQNHRTGDGGADDVFGQPIVESPLRGQPPRRKSEAMLLELDSNVGELVAASASSPPTCKRSVGPGLLRGRQGRGRADSPAGSCSPTWSSSAPAFARSSSRATTRSNSTTSTRSSTSRRTRSSTWARSKANIEKVKALYTAKRGFFLAEVELRAAAGARRAGQGRPRHRGHRVDRGHRAPDRLRRQLGFFRQGTAQERSAPGWAATSPSSPSGQGASSTASSSSRTTRSCAPTTATTATWTCRPQGPGAGAVRRPPLRLSDHPGRRGPAVPHRLRSRPRSC